MMDFLLFLLPSLVLVNLNWNKADSSVAYAFLQIFLLVSEKNSSKTMLCQTTTSVLLEIVLNTTITYILVLFSNHKVNNNMQALTLVLLFC